MREEYSYNGPMFSDSTYRVRPLSRNMLDTVVGWAAAEGWNPGLDDADIFWETDPKGFVGLEMKGELIGSGSIVSYCNQFGFMGFFIMRPEFRNQGLGAQLWHERVRLLRTRLDPNASIGMDGVFTMQPFYSRGGFVFQYRTPRMEGIGVYSTPDSRVVELSLIPFSQVQQFDQLHFGYDRTAFLKRWITPRNGLGMGFVRGNQLAAMGVIRPCLSGFKIGPLFAQDEESANAVFDALSSHATGKPIFLDTPECNPHARSLAQRKNMHEVFGCARMYLGTPPRLPVKHIYGITTFELG
jgi:GNAT superfamily N-acetyltransferase